MIKTSARRTDAASAETRDRCLQIQSEHQNSTELQLLRFEQSKKWLHLRDRARKPIKQENIPFKAAQVIGKNLLNPLRRCQVPGLGVGLDLSAEGCLESNLSF